MLSDGSSAGQAHRPFDGASEAELMAAIRARNERACARFIERYAPLLEHVAERFGLLGSERDHEVMDFLEDRLIDLISSRRAAPRSLAGYLVTGFTNRMINAVRAEQRELGRLERAGLVSDAGLPDECAFPEPVQRLVTAIRSGLTEEERLLLSWMAEDHPHSRIAAWLGIREKAASKRIERLHRKCLDRAASHLNALPEPERSALRNTLDRWAVAYEVDATTGFIANARPRPRRRA
jgi:RNA polymerase sigma factor (sigma-70 family)